MTLSDFKKRIAQRFDTVSDNIIVSIGEKQYRGRGDKVDENKLFIQTDLGINEYTVVKVELKDKPKKPEENRVRDQTSTSKNRNKSKTGYSSSVVVTTTHVNDNHFAERSRGQT